MTEQESKHNGNTVQEIETDKEGKLWYKAINSWGRSYGKNGTMWIPEEFPWLENPWAIVDHRTKTKWDNYRNKYNL